MDNEKTIPLHADFSKISHSLSKPSIFDTIRGVLYSNYSKMFIKVTHPVLQLMIIDSTSSLIYYPEEKSALLLKRSNRPFMPFFQMFINFIRNEQPAPDIHFSLEESIKKDDTLYTFWIPSENRIKHKLRVTMAYCSDRPLSTSTFDKNGHLIGRMRYLSDTLLGGNHVPKRIMMETAQNTDVRYDDVVFSDILFGGPFSPELLNFHIPVGVPVKEMEW
jgi:hypothetical protein